MPRKKKAIVYSSVLAIIGSAGRGKDFNAFTLDRWNECKRIVFKLIQDNKFEAVTSGGAAFVDNLAVQLYLKDIVKDLQLELPCNFDKEKAKFWDDKDIDTARVSNYYHQIFSQKFGIDSLDEIKRAVEKGARVTVGDGFFDRNVSIAKKATHLIAFTFGSNETVKEGGTSFTTKIFLNSNDVSKTWHVDLNTMALFNGAKV